MELSKRVIEPQVVVLEIVGGMRMGADCQRLTQTAEDLIHANERRMILDLSRLDMIDSAGVGAIVSCFSLMKKAGGIVRVAGAHGMVDTVLHLTQVYRAIEFFPTVAEAAGSFPSVGPSTPPRN